MYDKPLTGVLGGSTTTVKLAGPFEEDLQKVFDACSLENKGKLFWSATTNVIWEHEEKGNYLYSFRAAGDVVAALHEEGNYIDWYCESEPKTVHSYIAEKMQELGWTPCFEDV